MTLDAFIVKHGDFLFASIREVFKDYTWVPGFALLLEYGDIVTNTQCSDDYDSLTVRDRELVYFLVEETVLEGV